MRLLSAVHHGVADQVALLGEAASALRAAVGPLARVAPLVLLELAEPGEALVAVRAAEPLLAQAAPPRRPHAPRQAGGGGGVGRRGIPVAVLGFRRHASEQLMLRRQRGSGAGGG